MKNKKLLFLIISLFVILVSQYPFILSLFMLLGNVKNMELAIIIPFLLLFIFTLPLFLGYVLFIRTIYAYKQTKE